MTQKLSFRELYENSRKEVRDTLTSMWTTGFGEANDYEKEIGDAIDNFFAPEDTMPIVQAMFPWEPMSETNATDIASDMVGAWNNDFSPYKHQYECWKSLLVKKRSICITTGTGSGKTEAFMLPMIKALRDNPRKAGQTGVRAIMLYPLNALAEDQKERLNKYIEAIDQDGNMMFAVYNGSTPQSRPADEENKSQDTDSEGIGEDGETSVQSQERYNRELVSRTEIRNTPPDILVTNPTMLEYIMLRDSDKNILGDALSWFIIDETHTFKGAAAAELSLLIRRTILASGHKDSSKITFATSSATTGSGDDKELKKFIADIAWKKPEDIDIIGGKRILPSELQNGENKELANQLLAKDYIPLDELITEGDSTPDKLGILDELCESHGFKVKVHYFFQAPSLGLSTRLDEVEANGKFPIYNKFKSEPEDSPLVELVRCGMCGSILAQANVTSVKEEEKIYEYGRLIKDDTEDTFEVISDDEVQEIESDEVQEIESDEVDTTETEEVSNASKTGVWLFAPATSKHPGACKVEADAENGWKIIVSSEQEEGNTLRFSRSKHCPCCNSNIDKQQKNQGNELHEQKFQGDYLRSLRVDSMFISRILSRTFLDQMSEAEKDTDKKPYGGRQYISFVDNRQAAAKLTLDQTKDVEEQWLQSRVLKILSTGLTEDEENELNELDSINRRDRTREQIDKLRYLEDKENSIRNGVSWDNLYNRLVEDFGDEVDQLLNQAIVLDADGKNEKKDIEDEKRIYIMTLMYEQLGSRKRNKETLETLGLIQPYYPALDAIDWEQASCKYFADFNDTYCEGMIVPEEWKHLVQIYIDYNIRTAGSVYYYNKNHRGTDITRFRRFASRRESRRPVFAPKSSAKNLAMLLAAVSGMPDNRSERTDEENEALYNVQKGVFNLLKDNNTFTETKEKDGYRMNLTKMSFRLSDRGYYCPKSNSVIPYTFKGYSPYYTNKIKEREITKAIPLTHWSDHPISNLLEGVNEEDIIKWYQEKTKIDDNDACKVPTLSKKGARLLRVAQPIYVSAEHTAQIDKSFLEEYQKKFVAREINILTCSTTMEMGVDLGNLELVVMNSIPPHPANYRQRAGRSGRKFEHKKSAAVTICGSDSLGKLTMEDTMKNLINRPYATPHVDLSSRQIVQRHVNALLLKKYGDNQLGDSIVDFFGHEAIQGEEQKYRPETYYEGHIDLKIDMLQCNNKKSKTPNFRLGNSEEDYHAKWNVVKEALEDIGNLDGDVVSLLSGTPYEPIAKQLMDETPQSLKRVFDELKEEFDVIASVWSKATLTEDSDYKDRVMDNNAYARRINYQYTNLLRTPLINYLATHQFSPNAAMPLNIVEFDTQEDDYRWTTKRKPSYTLHRALSQYAPGRLVILGNKVYRSSGVEWRDRFSDNAGAFKTILQDEKSGKMELVNEGVNGNRPEYKAFTMITPTAFRTDKNKLSSRITDGQIYTRTEAHLIGVDKWNTGDGERTLIKVRTTEEGKTSEILYVNTGKGNGYCVCRQCGRAELETDEGRTPTSFLINREGREPENKHFRLYDNNECDNDVNDRSTLMRNVVFGDTIQTDYCDMQLSHIDETGSIKAFDTSEQDQCIMHTLGMLICDYMSKILGIERGEIDYIVTTVNTLCIYDLAKGGAGYSIQLMDENILVRCLEHLRNTLNEKNEDKNEYKFTADQLINSFTIFNEKYIDIDATRKWLEDEYHSRKTVPDAIKSFDSEARQFSAFKFHLEEAVKSNQPITLFADLNSVEEGYSAFVEKNESWYYQSKPENTSLCFLNVDDVSMPYVQLTQLAGHTTLNKMNPSLKLPNGIYPLAIIGDRLFVTDNQETISLSDAWGSGNKYTSSLEKMGGIIPFEDLNVTYPASINSFQLNGETRNIEIDSNHLYETIKDLDTKGVIQQFINCHSGKNLSITYEDRFTRSPLSLLITTQFIDQLVRDCNGTVASIKFHGEQFEEKKYRKPSKIFHQYIDDYDRDKALEALCEEYGWNSVDVKSFEKCNLKHDRYLTIESNTQTLIIIPGAGLAYNWFVDTSDSLSKKANISKKDTPKIGFSSLITYTIIISDE